MKIKGYLCFGINGLFILVVVGFLQGPVTCYAKGVAINPLVMKGTIEDMKMDGDKVSFLFTGELSKSQWAKGEWDMKAVVTKLPIIVDDRTYFYRDGEYDAMWGYRFKEEKEKALACVNSTKNLTITIHVPTVYFSETSITRIEGGTGQIKGC